MAKKLLSLTGAPLIQLKEWIDTKDDPTLLPLWERHFAAEAQGVSLANDPLMHNLYTQFLTETNQTTIDE